MLRPTITVLDSSLEIRQAISWDERREPLIRGVVIKFKIFLDERREVLVRGVIKIK
jgi:hypothetical protein